MMIASQFAWLALIVGAAAAYRPGIDGTLQRPAGKFTGE